jgi:hypothetical protein
MSSAVTPVLGAREKALSSAVTPVLGAREKALANALETAPNPAACSTLRYAKSSRRTESASNSSTASSVFITLGDGEPLIITETQYLIGRVRHVGLEKLCFSSQFWARLLCGIEGVEQTPHVQAMPPPDVGRPLPWKHQVDTMPLDAAIDWEIRLI